MGITNLYLSPDETTAIHLLADGKSYTIVKKECHLTTLTLSPFLVALRRRTGILDTHDAEECQAYLRAHAEAVNGPGPTPKQLEAMCRLAGVGHEGHTETAMSYRMGLTETEGAELLTSACKAIGIFARDRREQRVQMRIYLAANVVLPARPLTENHLLVLHLYAQGASAPSIASFLGMKELYAKTLIEEGTLRLGVLARGRGLQRRLVTVALAHRAKREHDEQNDPLF